MEKEHTTLGYSKIMIPFLGPSALVTVFGIVTNLLSLSYYVTRRNSNDRMNTTETLNKRLFIFLNSFDILVCISLMGWLLLDYLDETDTDKEAQHLFRKAFVVTVECTGFITCLLSVVRTISIIWPHHQLNTNVIIVASIVFGLVTVTLETLDVVDKTLRNTTDSVQFLFLLIMFVIVIFSNSLCIAKLAYSQMASWKRDATITMEILSILYCICNIGFLVICCFRFFGNKCDFEVHYCLSPEFEITCLYILLPLNSACNPIVYFIRNSEMRKYLINIGGRILGLFKFT